MDVALVELMEDLVLVVDNAAEGAGLVIATGQKTGQVLKTVSIGETGKSLPSTACHHAKHVWSLGPLGRPVLDQGHQHVILVAVPVCFFFSFRLG